MANETSIQVTVVYSPAARQVHEWAVELPEPASVAQALRASGFAAAFPELDWQAAGVGIWGRQARPGQLLQDGDRIEIYRLLQVDPKVARRERFRRQGARTAGLFARQRDGSKPGY